MKFKDAVPPGSVAWVFFVQQDDPAPETTNEVGPGKGWIELDGATPPHVVGVHTWDPAGTGWLHWPLGSLGSGGDSSTLEGHPAADFVLAALIGAANGVASLDSGSKILVAQLPAAVLGAVNYQGTWNATTNSPTIPAAASGNKGYYYRVATAGSTSVGGITDWKVGDWIISNGAAWEKVDNTDQVVSVAGKQGTVTLDLADITDGSRVGALEAVAPSSGEKAALAGTSGTPGAGNKFVTDADSRLGGTSLPTGGTTGQVLTKQSATDGDADWGDAPAGGGGAALTAARVRNSAAQSIPNSTDTPLTWNTEDYDAGIGHDTGSNTSRLPAPVTGKYRISAVVEWAGNATGERYLQFFKNGTGGTRIGAVSNHPAGAYALYQSLSIEVDLTAGDYVDVVVFQNSGGALNCGSTGGSQNTAAAITLIAPASSAWPDACSGRLTLESGVPVSTTDQTGKTTIYWTPYQGARIALYDGSNWVLRSFAETSLALGTLTSGKNYDVFAYDNAGTLALELSAAWTSDTVRADALALQDGVYCKSGTLTRRYLGTFRTTSTTTTEDSGGGTTTQVGGKRFVWNYYHRVPRGLKVHDTTSTWTYGTDTWRQANGAAGNKVEYVCGVNEETVKADLSAFYSGTTNAARIGRVSIGLDSTTTPGVLVGAGYNNQGSGGQIAWSIPVPYLAPAGLGYHYLSWMEKGADGTSVFWGSNAGVQSGLTAWING